MSSSICHVSSYNTHPFLGWLQLSSLCGNHLGEWSCLQAGSLKIKIQRWGISHEVQCNDFSQQMRRQKHKGLSWSVALGRVKILIRKLKGKCILLCYLLHSRCRTHEKSTITNPPYKVWSSAADIELLCTAIPLRAGFLLLQLKIQSICSSFL